MNNPNEKPRNEFPVPPADERKAKIRADISPDYKRFLKAVKKKRMEHAAVTALLTVSFSAILASAILHSKENGR